MIHRNFPFESLKTPPIAVLPKIGSNEASTFHFMAGDDGGDQDKICFEARWGGLRTCWRHFGHLLTPSRLYGKESSQHLIHYERRRRIILWYLRRSLGSYWEFADFRSFHSDQIITKKLACHTFLTKDEFPRKCHCAKVDSIEEARIHGIDQRADHHSHTCCKYRQWRSRWEHVSGYSLQRGQRFSWFGMIWILASLSLVLIFSRHESHTNTSILNGTRPLQILWAIYCTNKGEFFESSE